MSFLTNAKITKVEDEILGTYNLIDIPINIEDLGLSINLSLCKKNIRDSLNTRNTTLIRACGDFVRDNDIKIGTLKLDNRMLSSIVSDLAMQAFGSGENMFLVEVDTPKETLKRFKEENRETLQKMKTMKGFVKEVSKEKEVTLNDIMNAISKIQTQEPIIVNRIIDNSMANESIEIPSNQSRVEEKPKDPNRKLTVNEQMEKREKEANAKTNSGNGLYKRSLLQFS